MQAGSIRQFRLHEKRKFCLSTWPFNFCFRGSRLLSLPAVAGETFRSVRLRYFVSSVAAAVSAAKIF
jgi:hypothetical protein